MLSSCHPPHPSLHPFELEAQFKLDASTSLQAGWGTAVPQHGGMARVECALLAWPRGHHLGVWGSFSRSTGFGGMVFCKGKCVQPNGLHRAAASCLHCCLLANGLQNEKRKTKPVSWPSTLGVHKTKLIIEELQCPSRGAGDLTITLAPCSRCNIPHRSRAWCLCFQPFVCQQQQRQED